MKMIPQSPRVVNIPLMGRHRPSKQGPIIPEQETDDPAPVSPAPNDDFYAFAFPPATNREDVHSPKSFEDIVPQHCHNNNNNNNNNSTMGNRRRAHTEEARPRHDEGVVSPTLHNTTTTGLPMAPCLQDLPDQQQRWDAQQFLAAVHAETAAAPPETSPTYTPIPDARSAVSSISNTSWERYAKLRDRYGWVPPPPPPEGHVEAPFVPPPVICFARKQQPQPKTSPPTSEIPDWLRLEEEPTATTTPTAQSSTTNNNNNRRRRHARAQTLPSLAEIAAQAAPRPPPERIVMNNNNKPAMPPDLNNAAHPLLRMTVMQDNPTKPPKAQPPRRRHHARGSSDQLPTTLMGQLDLNPLYDPQPNAMMNTTAMPPALDATSITSADDDEDEDRLEWSSSAGNNAALDTDTTKTHFKLPTLLWDKCVRAPVQKVLGGNHNNNNHRRSQSYDFKASPSACFS